MEMTTKHLKNLLKRLDHPEALLKVVHVGGTNGKGSVCKMTESVLILSGYKTGTFMSPSPVDEKHCITINQSPISQIDFDRINQRLADEMVSMEDEGQTLPSEFECLVACAVIYFTEKNVDIALIEVGMGGLNDATNIFDKPLLSIITGVDYDHMQFLGDTLEAIATQKSGIIKSNRPIIIGDMAQSPKNIILNTALQLKAIVYDLFKEPLDYHSDLVEDCTYTSETECSHPYVQNVLLEASPYRLKLMGEHQIKNLYMAICALNLLSTDFPHIKHNIHKTGDMIWPCRQEIFQKPFNGKASLFMFDGAHNPQSMDALLDTVSRWFSHKKITLVFSALSDKNLDDLLVKLSTVSEKLILTHIDYERGSDTDILLEVARYYFKEITIIETPYDALLQASKDANDDSMILVTGSLYLTVPLRNQLLPLY